MRMFIFIASFVIFFLFTWSIFDQYSEVSKFEIKEKEKLLEMINRNFSNIALKQPSREEELLNWNKMKS